MTQILGVSVWHDGVQYNLPAPNRHFHVIRHIHALTGARGIGDRSAPDGRGGQGFYVEGGVYLDRIEARELAVRTGQCLDPEHHRNLFSEDLW